ncbi:MAG: ribonuclease HII, partial [Candidatus Nealsonbacteria bacterium]
GVEWGIGIVSEKIIDKINILEATKLAMTRAVKNLESKLRGVGLPLNLRGVRHHKIDFLILDGNFSIKSDIPQKSIIKGDEKVFSCSCASIIAKVTRDRIMLRYNKKYPCYGFASNKGYPTEYHRSMIKKYGACKIHRQSFVL